MGRPRRDRPRDQALDHGVPKQKEWAKRLADAGVAVTILPATDLFLMGRERDYNVRRGLVDANLFVE